MEFFIFFYFCFVSFQIVSIFTLVKVQLQADGAPMKYSAVLKRPEGNKVD